jgi:hypothetical protein
MRLNGGDDSLQERGCQMTRIRWNRKTLGRRRTFRLVAVLIAGGSLGAALLAGSGAAQPRAAPASIAAPQLLGSPVVHNVLTATAGAWSGSAPMTVTYEWLSCPPSGGGSGGSGCVTIAHARGPSYRVRSRDVGFSLRVRVSATNAAGSASAASEPSVAVVPAGRLPVSTTLPRVFGKALVGRTLTGSPGTVHGPRPISFGYQWLRCDKAGVCSNVGGATSRRYTPTAQDTGDTLRVLVTATNAAGSTSAASLPTAPVAAVTVVAPRSTAEPRIAGVAVEGSTLSATAGSWSGTGPFAFAYQWRRCPQNGGAADASNCAVIPDASKSTYTVRAADVGFRLRVRVRASNAAGSATATSNPTEVVKAAATKPVSTSPPTISGSAVVGQTLTASPGQWSGTQPITFSYQWGRCDAHGNSCSAIAGATAKTYAPKDGDVGSTLRVRVTARNSAGSASADSAPTAVVAGAPKPGCPAGTGAMSVAQVTSPARLLVDGLQVSPSVITRSTSTIVLRFHVSACQGRSVQGALVYATAVPFNQFSIAPEQGTGPDGWATLQMSRLSGFPAARGQQLLVVFVRARKPGEDVLAGISTRRLVSFPVNLSR